MIEQVHYEHAELSIERLCELFSVSRSWYYERSSQPESTQEETALRDQIERIILEFPGYGYRRVTHALAREGMSVNHKRVLRIMREESLLCHLKKRFVVRTTDSRHGLPVYPNVLTDAVLTAPDQAWGGGPDLYSLAECLCVPGLYSGCVFAPLCGLASVTGHDHAIDARGFAPGYCRAPPPARFDPSFRSRGAICQS